MGGGAQTLEMPKFKPILSFVLWLALFYGLLITPWPGMKRTYAGYFQSLGNILFARHDGPRRTRFQPLDNRDRAWPDNFDTAILIGNRYALNDQGKPKVFLLAVDAWQMGWTPTAFLVALVLATPISWQRRLWSLLLSLLCVHSFILLTVGISIWNESTRISLVTLTPFWKAIANQVEDLALDPVGPSFFAAALIWILVSFRRQDFTCLPQR